MMVWWDCLFMEAAPCPIVPSSRARQRPKVNVKALKLSSRGVASSNAAAALYASADYPDLTDAVCNRLHSVEQNSALALVKP